MFVLNLKWSRKLAAIVIVLAALLLIAIILAVSAGSSGGGQDPNLVVRNNDERVAYLEGLGWAICKDPICEKDVVIPQNFSEIYEKYNELQLAQGFDFSEYKGLEVTIFTYALESYPNFSGNVVADLYVSNSRVIGGDIHSMSLDGFMHGLIKP